MEVKEVKDHTGKKVSWNEKMSDFVFFNRLK